MSEISEASTATEESLEKIWMQSLQRTDHIQPLDSFFELGGDSIMMMMMMMQISQQFGVELAPEQIFETPTLRGTAAAIEMLRKKQMPASEPRVDTGEI